MCFDFSYEEAVDRYYRLSGRNVHLRPRSGFHAILERVVNPRLHVEYNITSSYVALAEEGLLTMTYDGRNSRSFSANDLSRDCLRFFNNLYFWSIKDRCPDVVFSVGYYAYCRDEHDGIAQDHFKIMKKHYFENKSEVDSYISLAMLSK